MAEINLFLDKAKEKPIDIEVDFGIVKAGETTEKIIYIENVLDVKIILEWNISGDNISFRELPSEIGPKETTTMILKVSPPVTLNRSLKGKIDLKYDYVI